jgi:hypothetical protein
MANIELTDERVEALMREAGAAGDTETVEDCREYLYGSPDETTLNRLRTCFINDGGNFACDNLWLCTFRCCGCGRE